MRATALRHSIGTKIFGAFLAMSFIVGALGVYGYHVLAASGGFVADTYDYPMMAINYARAASVDFLEMETDALRAEHASPRESARLNREIDDLASTLSDDLSVAEERATAGDERSVIRSIRGFVASWQSERHSALVAGQSPDLAALDQKILAKFDLLTELNADHGFVSRREALGQIESYKGVVISLTGMAVLLGLGITLFLARQIVKPLSAAALVADRIASGELETPIPPGGRDETGVLLQSMRVMQGSIAGQMAREKARAQSAEVRLMDAVESSIEGVILADGSGDIAIANSELGALFPSDAVYFTAGRPLAAALCAIDAQCANKDGASLGDQLAGERASAERQLPNGRWLRITASRTSEGGRILFFSDFTDIKAREEGYRVAKQQAEAANAAKSRFLANMSHELRTPLNAVIGFSEVMSGEMFGPIGNPRYLEYSADILTNGRHLLEVINSVLDIAKTESGNFHLRKQKVNVETVLAECANTLRIQRESAGLDYVAPDLREPVFVEADEARLRQIFFNLLSNAIRFTEKGGTIGAAIAASGEEVRIDIRDTGIGMSREDIETALIPFAQVDARLARRYEGTGLGLPLAKALVELHGGTLSIESEKGRGTTVSVRLARLAVQSEAPKAAVG